MLIYTWMANFVDSMYKMKGLGDLCAPRGVSSAPLKHQSLPLMYLSYFASWDLMYMDVFPTRIPYLHPRSARERGESRTGCCSCWSNLCMRRAPVLHGNTAKGAHQRLRSLGLGTIQVCEEKQTLYSRVINLTENNKKWLEEEKESSTFCRLLRQAAPHNILPYCIKLHFKFSSSYTEHPTLQLCCVSQSRALL